MLQTENVGDMLRRLRKARQISQMDLALDANVSTRHLSFVETGRAQPSDDLLLRLAEALDLPSRHTNALLLAAGYAPRHAGWSLDDDDSGMIRAALRHTLTHHDPYPALVTDGAYNLLMGNASLRRVMCWLSGDESLLARHDNVYRLVFAPDGLQPYLAGWEGLSRVLLKRLREESLAYQNDDLAQLYAECAAMRGNLDEDESDVFSANFPALTLTLCKGEQALTLFSTIATFGTAIDVTLQDLRIESFFPADANSERLLHELAR